jgi:hypothetical protein
MSSPIEHECVRYGAIYIHDKKSKKERKKESVSLQERLTEEESNAYEMDPLSNSLTRPGLQKAWIESCFIG